MFWQNVGWWSPWHPKPTPNPAVVCAHAPTLWFGAVVAPEVCWLVTGDGGTDVVATGIAAGAVVPLAPLPAAERPYFLCIRFRRCGDGGTVEVDLFRGVDFFS